MTANFEARFAEHGEPQLDLEFGVTIQIQRGAFASDAMTADWSDEMFEGRDDRGIVTTTRFRVYEVTKADCVINGRDIEPREGDWITETINGVVCKFEVMPVTQAKAVQELPGGFRWRVETKRVK